MTQYLAKFTVSGRAHAAGSARARSKLPRAPETLPDVNDGPAGAHGGRRRGPRGLPELLRLQTLLETQIHDKECGDAWSTLRTSLLRIPQVQAVSRTKLQPESPALGTLWQARGRRVPGFQM